MVMRSFVDSLGMRLYNLSEHCLGELSATHPSSSSLEASIVNTNSKFLRLPTLEDTELDSHGHQAICSLRPGSSTLYLLNPLHFKVQVHDDQCFPYFLSMQ